MIDTLSYTRDLMKAGLTEEQAELMVRSQFTMISNNVSTKADLLEVRNDLTADLLQLRNDLNADLLQLRNDLTGDLLQLRNDLTKVEHRIVTRLGSLIIVMFGALATLQTFLS